MTFGDSITAQAAPSPLQETAQYVHGYALPDTDVAGLLRIPTSVTDPWVLLGVVVLLMALLLVLAAHFRYLIYRVKDFFASERKFADVPQQATLGEVMTYVVPIFTGVSGLGLIAADYTQQLPLAGFSTSRYMLYGIISVGVLVFLLLKIILYALVNWVFFDSVHTPKWSSSYLFLTSLLSVPILPLSVVYLYAGLSLDVVSNCLLTWLILYEILIFYKMNTNFRTKNDGKVLIFLYFCTVEILPLLVAGHFFLNCSSFVRMIFYNT